MYISVWVERTSGWTMGICVNEWMDLICYTITLSVSETRTAMDDSEQWIGKDAEENGRGLI